MAEDVVENCGFIDLSIKIQPNVLKVNYEYIRGNHAGGFNLQQFLNAENGTHFEGPLHLKDGLKSLMDLPSDRFMSEAFALKLEHARNSSRPTFVGLLMRPASCWRNKRGRYL